MTKIYDFKVQNIKGEEISLNDFKGKVVLIVNTASKCGFTKQFEGLEKLYNKYKSKDFVVIGFPCNQFGNQEPGNSQAIQEGCMIDFGVTFPMMEKIEVNGNNENPLYTYLKEMQQGALTNSIKWNFTKFLIDKEGTPVNRFKPTTVPEKLERYIEELL
ncbi:MAG: glutathione peroxidase [Nanoarchaeales archaeon]|nr:glutathione peroxidase [Nanoarchaeales archaeon]